MRASVLRSHEQTCSSDMQHSMWQDSSVQAQNMTKLTALQEQQQDSDVRLAELKQQHEQLQAQLQQQVQPVLQALHSCSCDLPSTPVITCSTSQARNSLDV